MRVAAFSLAAVLTTACATTLPTPEAAFTRPPLSVRWLDLSGRNLHFTLSQPAHTAIFDITSGAGAGLIYPGTFDRQYQRTGLITPIMPRYVPAFSGYQQSAVASYYAGPRMLLVVASRSPLRLEGLFTAGGMRRRIGNVHFASYFPQQTVEHVLHGVLPLQADDDWDADVLVIWPQAVPSRFVRQYRVLVCDDRTTLVVPITGVHVLLGQGGGRFRAARGSPFGDGADAWVAAVTDVNEDGAVDLVVPSGAGDRLAILLGGRPRR